MVQAVMDKASASCDLSLHSEETRTINTEKFDPLFRPQANSLAMALGMKNDPSSQLQLLTISVTKVRTL
jgi:hypothetical protein